MGTIYISIILACRVVQHLYNKKTSIMVKSLPQVLRFGGMRQCMSAFLALVLIVVGGNGIKFDKMTVLLSLLSGTMIMISMTLSLYAMRTGMIALVTLFGTAGMIVPCVAGIFLFDTPVSVMQWVGVGIFMVAAYLLIVSSKQAVSGFSVKTMLLLLGIMLCEGCTMLAQQMFTHYVPDGDVSMFSFLSFGIVGAAMLVAVPFVSKAAGEKNEPMPRKLIIYGAALATALLIINQLATLATAIVPPVILFTFINGGSTVIAAIVAAAVYKEKLTVRSVLGIILGVFAFVVIKAFD